MLLSGHLWFSSFFPVEFEFGRCVLPSNSLSPNNTVSPHFHSLHQTKKKFGHGVIRNASFNPKTILSGIGAGPRKKPSATPPCNSFKCGILRPGQHCLHFTTTTSGTTTTTTTTATATATTATTRSRMRTTTCATKTETRTGTWIWTGLGRGLGRLLGLRVRLRVRLLQITV